MQIFPHPQGKVAKMLRTIRYSSRVLVQGRLQETLKDGRIAILVGQSTVTGSPVATTH